MSDKQAEIMISSSASMTTDDDGCGIVSGVSFRAYAVIGGVPMWSAIIYGDKDFQDSVVNRMQRDIKPKVEIIND